MDTAFQVVTADDGNTLALTGELDIASVDQLVGHVNASNGNGLRESLVLDLSELRFIDSAGLRGLLWIAEQTAGGLILRKPRGEVLRVLMLVRLYSWPTIKIDP